MTNAANPTNVSLYVVKSEDGTYFGGYSPAEGNSRKVQNPLDAKFFTNKYDIKLRPSESIVELVVQLTPDNVTVLPPFRPHRRQSNK